MIVERGDPRDLREVIDIPNVLRTLQPIDHIAIGDRKPQSEPRDRKDFRQRLHHDQPRAPPDEPLDGVLVAHKIYKRLVDDQRRRLRTHNLLDAQQSAVGIVGIADDHVLDRRRKIYLEPRRPRRPLVFAERRRRNENPLRIKLIEEDIKKLRRAVEHRNVLNRERISTGNRRL